MNRMNSTLHIDYGVESIKFYNIYFIFFMYHMHLMLYINVYHILDIIYQINTKY